MKKESPSILVIASSSWNIYNYRLGLLEALHREGLRVFVAAPVDRYIKYLNQVPFIHHIPLLRMKRGNASLWQELLSFFELIRICLKYRPGLVLLYNIKPNILGNLAAKLTGTPTISTITGLGYAFLHGSAQRQISSWLYKISLKYTRRVIFHNHTDLDQLVHQKVVDANRAEVVLGSGVNTRYFYPALEQPGHRPFTFLFLGRLLYDKGLTELVQAVRKLKKAYPGKVECLVLGEIDKVNPACIAEQELTEWMETAVFRYLGLVNDVRPYLEKCHALVLPSYREGMPRAVLEAMAMAKPVITTQTAGCDEAVEHGINGFLVPPQNADALFHAMETLYQLPQNELIAMGKAGRKRVLERFDERLIIRSYRERIAKIFQSEMEMQEKQHVL